MSNIDKQSPFVYPVATLRSLFQVGALSRDHEGGETVIRVSHFPVLWLTWFSGGCLLLFWLFLRQSSMLAGLPTKLAWMLIAASAIGALMWPLAFLLQLLARYSKAALCRISAGALELPRQGVSFPVNEIAGLFVCRFAEDMHSPYSSSTLVGVTLRNDDLQAVALLRQTQAAHFMIDTLQATLGVHVTREESINIQGLAEPQLLSRVADTLRSDA